ncbi:MAG: outer membrane protein assembly factor BamA [Candidatus Coatesbacteria bacterium]|nr:MAG: outer membrane protein assembly factor BamA [Candidatus Coatesbacteria bacterium]
MRDATFSAAAIALLIGLLALGYCTAGPAPIVKRVRVEGARRVSPKTVLFYIKIKPGDTFSPAALSQQIHNLYALGFFDDIKVYTEPFEDGIALIFVVVERPLVDAIKITGNKKVKTDKIREKITVELKKPLDKSKLAESVAAIRGLYRQRGFSYAKITPEVNKVAPGTVVVSFAIDERAKVKVSDIIFGGNVTFSDFKLKGQLLTRERFCKHPINGVRFFFSKLGKFDPDQLEEDRKRIEHFYKSNGYIEVSVSKPTVKYSEKRKGLEIKFMVSEGKHYKIGTVAIEGNTVFSTDELMQSLRHIVIPGRMRFAIFRRYKGKLAAGIGYNLSVEETAMAAIRERYGSKGYIAAQVHAEHKLHRATGTVDILIKIDEGDQFRLGRLSFTGNTRTRDKVLRREVKVTEGDILDMTKLRSGIEKIRYLGYIEPEIKPELHPNPEKKTADVNIGVKEGRLHELRFSASYSKYQKFGIGGSIVEHNFLGYGQTFGVTVNFTSKSTAYDVDFDEPHLLDSDYSFGAGLYDHKTEYDWYTREAAGGRLTIGRQLSDWLHISNTYRLESVNVSDIGSSSYRSNSRSIHWDPGVSSHDRLAPLRSDIIYEEETSLTSSDMVSIWWDSRDSWIKPTRGIYALASGRLAGSILGGSNEFYKLKADMRYYFPLSDRFTLSAKGRLEYGEGYGGDTLPIFERYYLGGAVLGGRGFDTYELGPRDKNGNSVGGNKSLLFTGELFYVLADPLHVGVFFDAGQVFPEGESYQLDELRTSYGVEVRIFVPMFVYPIRLVYGIKRKPFEGEQRSSFDFAIGIGN